MDPFSDAQLSVT